MSWLSDPQIWVSLLTLTVMEIVSVSTISCSSPCWPSGYPPGQQERARRIGLLLALGMRLGFLAAISWMMRLTAPVFAIAGQ